MKYILILFFLLSNSLYAKPKSTDFKDWVLKCDESNKQCFLIQSVYYKKTKQRLVQFTVAKLEWGLSAIITLPLGVLLPMEVTFQIDNHQKFAYPYHSCNKNGCIAVIQLKKVLLKEFKAGNKCIITFYNINKQSVGIPVSLRGFTKGVNSLKSIQ